MLMRLLPVLVAAFFATAMTVKGAGNALVILLGLLSLPFMRGSAPEPYRKWLCLTLSAMAALTLLQLMAGVAGVSAKALDAPLRFVLAAMALWGLSRVPSRYFLRALWGLPLAAVGLGLWGWLSTNVPAYAWSDITRGWNGFSNPITFGVYSALFAFWLWIVPAGDMAGRYASLRWPGYLLRLSVLAALAGAYYSGTRAAILVCLPAMALLLLYYYRISWRKMMALVPLAALAAVLFVALSPDRFSTRFREGVTEIQQYDKGDGSSMGLRLSMWQYGGKLLLEHPLTGVGKQGYYREVSKLKDDPTPLQLISSAPHPHNEILNLAVEFGVLGIALGFALYLVPGLLFSRYLQHRDPVMAFAALAGMLVVVCQFVAGLFDAYFWIVSQTSFYGMSVVIFASMIFSRKRELGLS